MDSSHHKESCIDGPPQRAEHCLVAVVIVNFNCREYLQKTIDCLALQDEANFAAVIVDNASTDGSIENLALPDDRFRIVRLAENIGFAAANNFGAWVQPSDFIVTLNPDAFPEPDWLGRLLAAANQNPLAAAIGSTQIMAHDPSLWDGIGDCLFFAGLPYRGGHGHRAADLPDRVYETFSPCAAAALYRSGPFWRAGGFDESFFCFIEDVDLGFKLRRLGYECLQAPGAVVRHVGGATTHQVSLFTEYHEHRNTFFMSIKNLPLSLLPISLAAHVVLELIGLAVLPANLEGGGRLALAKVRLRAMRHGLSPRRWLRDGYLRSRRIGEMGVREATRVLAFSPLVFIRKRFAGISGSGHRAKGRSSTH